MRPLELAGEESAPPVSLSPRVPGTWNWIGTSALVFRPEGHLPRSTDFKATVAAGTRAVDGASLEAPYEFSFSTPVVAVARSEPSEGSSHLTPTTKVTLYWNQPVADADVERFVRIRSRGSAT